MINLLQNLFNKFSLDDIDSLNEIVESQIYNEFIQLYPNLESILSVGHEKDSLEFNRTMKHVFRTIKVFLLIFEGKFQYPNFSKRSINQIESKIKKITDFNPELIPLILVYHDIGKFVRKRDHPQQSFNLISKKGLLNQYKLDINIKKFIEKVIQYHILFATIYTGESTYYGTYSLINDEDLVSLVLNPQYLDVFVDCLEVFTYIDILGYSYSQIFDHYLRFYEKINTTLKQILSELPNFELALKKALYFSSNCIKWRLAGALRIFQFISTQTYLTERFYYEKLESSIKFLPKGYNALDWEILINHILEQSYRVQIKYGLAFLMILAFGSFQRASLDRDSEISSKLIYFWILLSQLITKRSVENPEAIWNVYILGIKNWFAIPKQTLQIINEGFIQTLIESSKYQYNKKQKEYTLNLDLSILENQDKNSSN